MVHAHQTLGEAPLWYTRPPDPGGGAPMVHAHQTLGEAPLWYTRPPDPRGGSPMVHTHQTLGGGSPMVHAYRRESWYILELATPLCKVCRLPPGMVEGRVCIGQPYKEREGGKRRAKGRGRRKGKGEEGGRQMEGEGEEGRGRGRGRREGRGGGGRREDRHMYSNERQGRGEETVVPFSFCTTLGVPTNSSSGGSPFSVCVKVILKHHTCNMYLKAHTSTYSLYSCDIITNVDLLFPKFTPNMTYMYT